MRRSLTIAASLATAGALFAAVPGIAATNGTCDGTGPRAGAGQGQGQGPGQGMGPGANQRGQGMGRGPGANAGQGLLNMPSGTLTDSQKAALAYMAEEEKLAHDVYTVLGKEYRKTVVFKRIAASEQRHWDAVVVLLDRYGIPNPTTDKAPGEFASAELQTMYTTLVGSADTRRDALKVGVAIEEDDIAELAKAGDGVTAQDVTTLYSHLSRASQMHLRAFSSRL